MAIHDQITKNISSKSQIFLGRLKNLVTNYGDQKWQPRVVVTKFVFGR
jgi:hypothetical protein